MKEEHSPDKLAAVCADCGEVYAARNRDGRIRLIGKRDECRCGSTEFAALSAVDPVDEIDDEPA